MNKNYFKGLVGLAILAAVGSAQAITFSNVTITGDAGIVGTLGTDHFVNTGATDIDFTFNKAAVGDNLALRFTTINITYEATSSVAMVLNEMKLSATTLLLGSGHVRIVETIEDVATPGIIANFSKDYYVGTFAVTENISFQRPSTHIKVKKTIFMDAFDTQAFDRASIGLIEQNIKTVPEPATMAALGLGLAAIGRRRRK